MTNSTGSSTAVEQQKGLKASLAVKKLPTVEAMVDAGIKYLSGYGVLTGLMRICIAHGSKGIAVLSTSIASIINDRINTSAIVKAEKNADKRAVLKREVMKATRKTLSAILLRESTKVLGADKKLTLGQSEADFKVGDKKIVVKASTAKNRGSSASSGSVASVTGDATEAVRKLASTFEASDHKNRVAWALKLTELLGIDRNSVNAAKWELLVNVKKAS
tara:strand:- start:380 stop:1036 length:657 start_codon:yes stop_codon:yes gene_type:complete